MKNFLQILAIIASILLIVFYAWPSWQNFQALRSQTSDLQNASAELDNLTQTHDQLINRINSISPSDLSLISESVPQGTAEGNVLVTFETFANRDSMSLKSIDFSIPQSQQTSSQPANQQVATELAAHASVPTPSSQTPGSVNTSSSSGINELDITFTVTGSYINFRRFLTDIEKSIRLIDVNSISFTSPSTKSQQGKIPTSDFSLKAKAYYQ